MQVNENHRTLKQTAKLLLKDYPDILKVDDLKKIFPKIGKNKIYKLLQDKEIYSKRIGRDYYIPKMSVIDYIIKN